LKLHLLTSPLYANLTSNVELMTSQIVKVPLDAHESVDNATLAL